MHGRPTAENLWFYRGMSKFDFLSYRSKILLTAFVAAHIPLIAVAIYFSVRSSADWQMFFAAVGVTLVATLIGTGLLLYALNHLLRPVLLTSHALREYREKRLRHPLPGGFPDEVGTLMADAGRTMDHLEGLLDSLEHHDEVTGLPNRRRFVQHLQGRLESGLPVSVLVLHVENIARVAESFDRDVADRFSRALAVRLLQRNELGDNLARLDQAYFAGILSRPNDGAVSLVDAASRARIAMEACAKDIQVDQTSITPVLRGGMAAFPEDGSDAVTLLERAISAVGQAGEAEPIMIHSARARQSALHRFRIEQDLRRAIDQDAFELFYQPVIDIDLGRATGAEALIRWRHPERGLVAPGEFIAAAESSGLIEPIGLWVLRSACGQVRGWNDMGYGHLRMAINLSPRQFLNPDLARHVLEAAEHHGISPAQLEFELTETSAMVDHVHTRRVFTSLRDIGVGISIDDFGTGFAGMSYLRALPFDKLKIDREFVANVHQFPDNQAICGALIALSRGLGLTVLAEGTESVEEVHYLIDHGCHLFQGYYFSRPVPGDEFDALLQLPEGFEMPERPDHGGKSRRLH
jgi:EAL domain-containing protein (putative c-di-GMP-specific phosphodiesterase class I)/GGDEF domain-containing protein